MTGKEKETIHAAILGLEVRRSRINQQIVELRAELNAADSNKPADDTSQIQPDEYTGPFGPLQA
jgi:hypothetical protein